LSIIISISVCPSCGSRRIAKVRRSVTRSYKGRRYVVPDLEFHECPVCGERLYGPEAMRRIEAYSPAFPHVHRSKLLA
jgi:YgiT-type zinc finger domain-containing protein